MERNESDKNEKSESENEKNETSITPAGPQTRGPQTHAPREINAVRVPIPSINDHSYRRLASSKIRHAVQYSVS